MDEKKRFIEWLHKKGHTKFTSLIVKRDNGTLIPLAQLFEEYYNERLDEADSFWDERAEKERLDWNED